MNSERRVRRNWFCKARHLCFALFQDVGVTSLSVLLALVAREALFDWPAGGVTIGALINRLRAELDLAVGAGTGTL